MCGIAGIVDLNGGRVDPHLVERLCGMLTHRGPDDHGLFVDNGVVLGHRRLSIIDLSAGRQPMGNEDGTVWVSFNGEIYNFFELQSELTSLGHRFTTRSDTETIVHAYEQYGADCLSRFRGMFAFAVWDSRRRELFLARDRVGKKPLFYTIVESQFVFASELQSLLAHPGVRRELDLAAVDDYLTYGYIPAPRSIFRGVFKLPPAHFLKVRVDADAGKFPPSLPQRYWRLEYAPKLRLGAHEAAEALLEILTEAVRLRMIADVPLGALLSGGVDSSVVVALMSRISSGSVKTFSIGFDESEFSELRYAGLVAKKYGTDHHELIVRANALEALPTLVRHYGEPFADSSAVPSFYVSRLTREHVTVALNGDGGDESFAGYERYYANGLADHYRKLPRAIRSRVIEPLAALIPNGLPRRHRLRQAKRFVEVAASPSGPRYLRWVSYFTPEQKAELYTEDFAVNVPHRINGEWLLELVEQSEKRGACHLDALLATDVESYLPEDLLVKMDIATMANSLEARSPLLDHVLMEFAARLPPRLKLRGATSKYLLRRVARDLVPAECLDRRKMGFGMPVGEWLRGDLAPLLDDVLLSDKAFDRGLFRPDYLRGLVREHRQHMHNNTYQLWALLWLELWFREFVG